MTPVTIAEQKHLHNLGTQILHRITLKCHICLQKKFQTPISYPSYVIDNRSGPPI